MQMQEIAHAAVSHARARVERGEVVTETETAEVPAGAGNPCSCITSCCRSDGAMAEVEGSSPLDDGDYDYYSCCFRYFQNLCCNGCSGCLDYLCNNIWQPIVNCFCDLFAGCGLYPTEYSEIRAVCAFTNKYTDNKGHEQQFYADFMKLPARAREHVRREAETSGAKDQEAFQEFIKENEHTERGVVMMSLRGFLNRYTPEGE